jgi:capsular polysaccharide biosynthesis protein
VRRTGFSTWRRNERYGDDPAFKGLLAPLVRVPQLRYCQSYVSWRYFGHWVTDAIPTAFLDPDMGAVWMPPDISWTHAEGYLATYGLAPLDAPLVHADELVVYQDFGQGSLKRQRYDALRSLLRSRFAVGDAEDLVFLRRGSTGFRRAIADEEHLIDALMACNWRVVDIGTSTFEDIQRALCRARVVVSMDGSHLTHAQMSLLPGSVLVLLLPHDRFTSVHVGYAQANRLSAGVVVLQGSKEDGYVVNLDEILRTVEMAEATGVQRYQE